MRAPRSTTAPVTSWPASCWASTLPNVSIRATRLLKEALGIRNVREAPLAPLASLERRRSRRAAARAPRQGGTAGERCSTDRKNGPLGGCLGCLPVAEPAPFGTACGGVRRRGGRSGSVVARALRFLIDDRPGEVGRSSPGETSRLAGGRLGDNEALGALLGNDDDALDATQEAMLAIARGIARFDGRSRFSAWCYRIASNAALRGRPRLCRDREAVTCTDGHRPLAHRPRAHCPRPASGSSGPPPLRHRIVTEPGAPGPRRSRAATGDAP